MVCEEQAETSVTRFHDDTCMQMSALFGRLNEYLRAFRREKTERLRKMTRSSEQKKNAKNKNETNVDGELKRNKNLRERWLRIESPSTSRRLFIASINTKLYGVGWWLHKTCLPRSLLFTQRRIRLLFLSFFASRCFRYLLQQLYVDASTNAHRILGTLLVFSPAILSTHAEESE